ncbi:MAG: FIST N-terminal domain-containing protein [Candidatus Tectimicrobiota bacterium]
MNVGVGVSTGREAAGAAREAGEAALRRAGQLRADAALCFATPDFFSEAEVLLDTLQTVCGTEVVVGASGAGVLTGKEEIEGAPGVVVLALASQRVSVKPVAVSDIDGLGDHWRWSIGDVVPETSLFVCLADTYAVAPEQLLADLHEVAPGVPVVGGGSCDEGTGERSFQFGPGGVVRGAVVGLVLSGVEVAVEVTQACSPVGGPYIITRADGSIVEELGGRPALEVLAEVVRGRDLRRGLFAGLSCVDTQTFGPGEYVVRPITALDTDERHFTVAAELSEGQSLVFALRDPKAARQDLERLLGDQSPVGRGGPAPAFGLYFNCCGRGRGLYGQAGVDTALLRGYLGALPLAGLFTGLELAPVAGRNRLQLFSGVLALVRPAD